MPHANKHFLLIPAETEAIAISYCQLLSFAWSINGVEPFGMKTFFIRSLVVIIVGLVILGAILLVHHRKAQLANQSMPLTRPVAVSTTSGKWGRLPITQHYLGTIEPEAEALLSAQTTGYITVLNKDVGDRLRKGEVAAEIDTRLSETKKNSLAAELVGAREDLATKQTIRNRRRELLKNRAVAQETLDEAELSASLAESRVRSLEQELSAAKVALSFSHLESFFDGIITERMKGLGDLVTNGMPVFRVENPDRGYKILIWVPQDTAATLVRNAPVRLLHGGEGLEMVVDRVHPAIVSGNLATVEIKSPTRPFNLPTYGVVGVDLTIANPEGGCWMRIVFWNPGTRPWYSLWPTI